MRRCICRSRTMERSRSARMVCSSFLIGVISVYHRNMTGSDRNGESGYLSCNFSFVTRHLEIRLPVSGLACYPPCHPERSEGSLRSSSQILRCAQDDKHYLQMSTFLALSLTTGEGNAMIAHVQGRLA